MHRHSRSARLSRLGGVASVGAFLLIVGACTRDESRATGPEIPDTSAILASLESRAPVAGEPGWTLEERMRRHRAPAVSLAVFDGYQIVWTAAFGLADVEANIPATTETLFQAGSISKPVAAAGVLVAAERGELDLDAPINTLLRSWQLPENEYTEEAPVTPRRLLSHTAGTTVHGFPGYSTDQEVPTVQQILDGEPPANTSAVRVDIVPGTEERYSGGGSTVMQLAMTDLAGEPYPELMRRTVLDPLGMTHSTYRQPLPPDWLERAAAGYLPDGRPVWGKRHVYPEMAAAGLWTTPTDLARFALDLQRALRGDEGTLLSRKTATEMITPVLADAGLGLFRRESNGVTYFGHNGADEGFQAMLVASREGGHGAAIMVNSDRGIALAQEILPAIARAFEWPGLAPTPLVPAEVDPQTLDAYVGRYQAREHQVREVRRDGDRLLWRSLLDEEWSRLVPRDDGTFVAQDDGGAIRFQVGEDSRVTGYVDAEDEEAEPSPRLVEAEKSYVELLDAGRTSEAVARLSEGELEEASLNRLGYTLLAFNRPEQAVAVFRLVVDLHPRSANAYDSLGDGYLALDDPAAAADAFRQVLATLAEDEVLPEERKPQYETRARTMIRRLDAISGRS